MRIRQVTRQHQRDKRRGIAAVEFAVVMPFVVFLLMGLWEVGRMVEVTNVLNNAAREAARQAATGEVSLATIQTNIQTYIQNAEPSITNLSGFSLQYTNVTHSSVTDPTQATQLDHFYITVSLPAQNVLWLGLNQITGTTTLSARVDWYSLTDLPVTAPTTLPVD